MTLTVSLWVGLIPTLFDPLWYMHSSWQADRWAGRNAWWPPLRAANRMRPTRPSLSPSLFSALSLCCSEIDAIQISFFLKHIYTQQIHKQQIMGQPSSVFSLRIYTRCGWVSSAASAVKNWTKKTPGTDHFDLGLWSVYKKAIRRLILCVGSVFFYSFLMGVVNLVDGKSEMTDCHIVIIAPNQSDDDGDSKK